MAAAAAAGQPDLESAFGATDGVAAEILALTAEEIRQRTAMLNNNCRVIRSDLNTVENEIKCVPQPSPAPWQRGWIALQPRAYGGDCGRARG